MLDLKTSDGRFWFDFEIDPDDERCLDGGDEPPTKLAIHIPSPQTSYAWWCVGFVSADDLVAALRAAGHIDGWE